MHRSVSFSMSVVFSRTFSLKSNFKIDLGLVTFKPIYDEFRPASNSKPNWTFWKINLRYYSLVGGTAYPWKKKFDLIVRAPSHGVRKMRFYCWELRLELVPIPCQWFSWHDANWLPSVIKISQFVANLKFSLPIWKFAYLYNLCIIQNLYFFLHDFYLFTISIGNWYNIWCALCRSIIKIFWQKLARI